MVSGFTLYLILIPVSASIAAVFTLVVRAVKSNETISSLRSWLAYWASASLFLNIFTFIVFSGNWAPRTEIVLGTLSKEQVRTGYLLWGKDVFFSRLNRATSSELRDGNRLLVNETGVCIQLELIRYFSRDIKRPSSMQIQDPPAQSIQPGEYITGFSPSYYFDWDPPPDKIRISYRRHEEKPDSKTRFWLTVCD